MNSRAILRSPKRRGLPCGFGEANAAEADLECLARVVIFDPFLTVMGVTTDP
jgi:hypothetical protein